MPWIELLRRVHNDRQRKVWPRIVLEAAHFALEKREIPNQYFRSMLYRDTVTKPVTYLSRKEHRKLERLFSNPSLAPLLRDKLLFQQHLQSAPGIQLPNFLGQIVARTYFPPDSSRPTYLGDVGSIKRTIDRILCRTESAIFAKPRFAKQGRGAIRVTDTRSAEQLWEYSKSSDYILQESVRQHDAFNQAYSESVNTLRMLVCVTNDTPQLKSAYLRFGRGGHYVDNASAGGFFCGVDIRTGVLQMPGITLFKHGAETFIAHPDTQFALGSLHIPYFHDAVSMALAASNACPHPVTGWDIAISQDGPIVIEGNHRPSYQDDEIANGPYSSSPLISQLIEERTHAKRTASA